MSLVPCKHLAVAAAISLTTILGCDSVRDAAGLAVDIERRFPGSRIETTDEHEDGKRKIGVLVKAPSFPDDVNLAEEAREIALGIREEFELRDSDTITIAFEAERRIGPMGSSQSASFVFPVSELARSD
jgi:hypothetical protein